LNSAFSFAYLAKVKIYVEENNSVEALSYNNGITEAYVIREDLFYKARSNDEALLDFSRAI